MSRISPRQSHERYRNPNNSAQTRISAVNDIGIHAVTLSMSLVHAYALVDSVHLVCHTLAKQHGEWR
jgi:hypothetical protein